MPGPTLSGEYFDELYEQDADPWRISVGWYEQRKRALTLAVLPDPHYGTVVEIGSGNGDLTVPLADRCDRLIALEGSARAVAAARQQVATSPHVEVRQGRVPDDCPSEPGDLIVLSEIGYYLSQQDLTQTLDRLIGAARPGATLVAVHWRHPAEGYPLSGDDVHHIIAARPGLRTVSTYRDDDVRLDVLSVGPQESVARRHGVL